MVIRNETKTTILFIAGFTGEGWEGERGAGREGGRGEGEEGTESEGREGERRGRGGEGSEANNYGLNRIGERSCDCSMFCFAFLCPNLHGHP